MAGQVVQFQQVDSAIALPTVAEAARAFLADLEQAGRSRATL